MLNALGHHQHFTLSERPGRDVGIRGAISKVKIEFARDHQEHLVSIIMLMPNEVALQFRNFDEVLIDLSDNFWGPLLLNLLQFRVN